MITLVNSLQHALEMRPELTPGLVSIYSVIKGAEDFLQQGCDPC